MFSRLLGVVAAGANQAWADSLLLEREAALLLANPSQSDSLTSSAKPNEGSLSDTTELNPVPASSSSSADSLRARHERTIATRRALSLAPPFKLAHDVPRGVLFMFHSFINYLLMLSVMTYDAWFFIAVLLGQGVGECAFGRFAPKHEAGGLHF